MSIQKINFNKKVHLKVTKKSTTNILKEKNDKFEFFSLYVKYNILQNNHILLHSLHFTYECIQFKLFQLVFFVK